MADRRSFDVARKDPGYADRLKALIGTELADEGVTDGEINEYGRECDDLIDAIGMPTWN